MQVCAVGHFVGSTKQEIVTCDRACDLSLAFPFLSHHFDFCSVETGVVAYVRRIWCVALIFGRIILIFSSIALGLGSKNLAKHLFLGD
jgi:hypothetical protein